MREEEREEEEEGVTVGQGKRGGGGGTVTAHVTTSRHMNHWTSGGFHYLPSLWTRMSRLRDEEKNVERATRWERREGEREEEGREREREEREKGE